MIRANRRLPNKRNKRMLWRTIVRSGFILSVCAILVTMTFYLNRVLSADHWEIKGAPPELATAIERELDTMQPMDYMHTRPAYLRTRLLIAIPDLADVRIERRLQGKLRIEVIVRSPVALWEKDEDVLFLVDKQGHPYRMLKPGESPDLPLLRMGKNMLVEAGPLLQQLKTWDEHRYTNLSECLALPDGWRLLFHQGQLWLLPHGDRGYEHMQELARLLQSKRWQNGMWKVDARLPKRWFFRKAKNGGVI